MRIIGVLVVLLALTNHEVHAKLGGAEEGQAERRLPRGGNSGARGPPPGQANKAVAKTAPAKKAAFNRASTGKPGPPPPKPARLDIKPVEWKEVRESFDDPDFMTLLTAQKGYVNYLNQKIVVEKEESDADIEEFAAEIEADQAESEEAAAVDEKQKAERHQRKVNARMKAQAAKERAKRAREQARALEATNESTVKALVETQETYREKLKTRALKAAKDTEDQVKKDKEQGKDKDRTVWRGMKEETLAKTKKAKDEAKKEMLMSPIACKAMEEAQEKIISARMVKFRRNQERLSRIPKRKGIPAEVLDADLAEVREMTDEDAVLVEASQEEAALLKSACKSLYDDQDFLEGRVLKVIENMQKRELAKIDAEDARAKYIELLDEKMEADKEAVAAGNEEASAPSDKEREAAMRRLEAARRKAEEKEKLREKAAKGLIEADNENIEALQSMIEKATEAKDNRLKIKLSPEQKQAMLILAEVQLDQSREQLNKYPEATKEVSEKQEQLLTVLHERFDQEKAVLIRSEEEEAIAVKLVEAFEATQKGPPDAAHELQKEALLKQLEQRKEVREAAELAEDEVALQKVALTQEQAAWEQSHQMMTEAEKWYEQLLIFEEEQARATDGDQE